LGNIAHSLTKDAKMNWQVFVVVLEAEYAAIVLQGLTAWSGGYLTQAQMAARGITGWSILEHGGICMDVIIISPAVAYFVSNHQFPYFSKWGLGILAVSIVAWLIFGYLWQMGGKVIPEAHTHDGMTTIAGWIHLAYGAVTTWVLVMVFVSGLATPPVSKPELIILAVALMPFFYYGVVKFNERWVFSPMARYQVIAEIVIVWAITIARVL